MKDNNHGETHLRWDKESSLSKTTPEQSIAIETTAPSEMKGTQTLIITSTQTSTDSAESWHTIHNPSGAGHPQFCWDWTTGYLELNPKPTPLWVCADNLATWYWRSKLRKISSCCRNICGSAAVVDVAAELSLSAASGKSLKVEPFAIAARKVRFCGPTCACYWRPVLDHTQKFVQAKCWCWCGLSRFITQLTTVHLGQLSETSRSTQISSTSFWAI